MGVRHKRPGRANWQHRTNPWRKERQRLKRAWAPPPTRAEILGTVGDMLRDAIAAQYGIFRTPSELDDAMRAQLKHVVSGAVIALAPGADVKVEADPNDRAKLIMTLRLPVVEPLATLECELEIPDEPES